MRWKTAIQVCWCYESSQVDININNFKRGTNFSIISKWKIYWSLTIGHLKEELYPLEIFKLWKKLVLSLVQFLSDFEKKYTIGKLITAISRTSFTVVDDFCFLAHLARKVKWDFLITFHLSSSVVHKSSLKLLD